MAQSDLSAWTPEIWAKELLPHLRAMLGVARTVNRNYDTEIQSYGKVVNVPLPPTLTARAKVRGQPIVPVQADASTIPVSLDRHIESSFFIDDIQDIQSKPDAMANFGEAAAIAIREQVESDILAKYTLASSSLGTAGGDFVVDNFNIATRRLNDSKAPISSRSAFLPPVAMEALRRELASSPAGAMFGDNQALRGNSVGRLHGFDIYETQLCPTVSGTPDSRHGIAFYRDAIIMVSRPTPIPVTGTGVRAVTVFDPELRLSVRIMITYNRSVFQYEVSYDTLYGLEVVRPEFLLELVA